VKEKVSLTQKVYLQKVLLKFDIGCETKCVSTPLAPHFMLSAKYLGRLLMSVSMSHISYASAVGSLMNSMVCMRPDLSQAVSMVSRLMHDSDKSHWETVRRI